MRTNSFHQIAFFKRASVIFAITRASISSSFVMDWSSSSPVGAGTDLVLANLQTAPHKIFSVIETVIFLC